MERLHNFEDLMKYPWICIYVTVFKGKYGYSITDWQAYKKIFAGACNEKAIGESSVSYMYPPNAAIDIKKNTALR